MSKANLPFLLEMSWSVLPKIYVFSDALKICKVSDFFPMRPLWQCFSRGFSAHVLLVHLGQAPKLALKSSDASFEV